MAREIFLTQDAHHIKESELSYHLSSYNDKIGFMIKMADGMIGGKVNAVMISGGPGIGKSWNLERLLDRHEEEGTINYQRVSGRIAPFAFYEALHQNASRKDVMFFDDCDSILYDDTSMNILKAGTELKKTRQVSWLSRANSLEQSFMYEGKILIATNINVRDSPHFEAIMDRFHVYELDVSLEERLAKIVDISRNSEEMQELGDEELMVRLVNYLLQFRQVINPEKLTIRSFVKLAELSNLLPDDWEKYAMVGNYVPLLEGVKRADFLQDGKIVIPEKIVIED